MTEYYDLVLGLIPLAMVGVTGGLSIAGVTLTTAVTLAGAISILLVGHAMFVNAPVDDAPTVVADHGRSPPAFEAAD